MFNIYNDNESLQILVVDDERSVLDMLANALGRLYSIRSATNVSDAVKILESQSVGVLITDLSLAGESGTSLAKIARKIDPNIEIIFITGHADVESSRIALDLGVVAYMTKPIDIMDLFSTVEKALHARRFSVKARYFSEMILHGVKELDNHIRQIVWGYHFVQRINQAIDVRDTVRLILTELSKVMNAKVIIMGINCLDYTDIYAFSSKGVINQDTVINLLGGFWKMEMSKAKFSLAKVRNKDYEITIFENENEEKFSPYGNSCSITNSIPIFGEEIGFISVYHDINTEMEEEEEGLFNILPPLIAPAIYRGHLERKSRHLANMDGLTGVANRRTFHEFLEKEIMRAARTKTDMSYLMIDIDFFRKLNDNYGHIAGDDVLKKITEVISSIIRNYDLLARFGGEEFTVILPDSDIDGAVKIAERIRETIEKTTVVAVDKNINFTVSIGVSTFKGKSGEEDISRDKKLIAATTEKLLRTADVAMSAAKQNNRNCIFYFDDETNAPVLFKEKTK
ncbi:MAG: diguanylate cyclase [Chitinivibrionia bacterium]|nr:diguanylate cyclase [Chitinivibrionia bacterium]